MDDTTRHFPLPHSQKQKNFRHLQTDTDQLAFTLVRGGLTKTIMRFGGTCADHKRWPLCRTQVKHGNQDISIIITPGASRVFSWRGDGAHFLFVNSPVIWN